MYTAVFFIILWLFVFEFLLTKTLDYLNTLNWSNDLPSELKDIYDEDKYKKSMEYEKVKYIFWSITWIFSFFIMLMILLFWWFWYLYDFISTFTQNEILRTLYFFWIILILQTLYTLPFSFYSTFVIEEKFWFNKSTKKIFFIDITKSIILSIIIWWLLISLITWIYLKTWNNFWIYTWFVITIFSIFMMMFYSSIIVPLFNKQTPLEKWDLRDSIEKFSKKMWFKLDNIYVIDGSKRSSKANAYFAWFWPKKRIVLYDTLINDLNTEELVSVLAHEIWHYKKKHTIWMLVFSMIQSAIMLYVLWLVLKMDELSYAMWSNQTSFAIWIVAFWILYSPISIIFSLLWNILSRKNEYEADEYAWKNYNSESLKNALKKLSRNNLSNLRPHPAYEFFNYSHPTVLKRLNALNKIQKTE